MERNPGPDSEEAAYNVAHQQTVHEMAQTIISQTQSKPIKAKL